MASEATNAPPEAAPGDPAEIAQAVVARATPDPAAGAVPADDGRPRSDLTGPAPSPFIPNRSAPPRLADAPAPTPATPGPREPRPAATSSDPGPASSVASAGAEDIAPAQVRRATPPDAPWIVDPESITPRRARRPSRAISTPAARPPIVSVAAPLPSSSATERPSLPVTAETTPDAVVSAPSPIDAAPVGPAMAAPSPAPPSVLPDADTRRLARPDRAGPMPDTGRRGAEAIALARVVPSGANGVGRLEAPSGVRALSDVPPVYRSRLDPNRTASAQRAGASAASEQAVERALDWLKRHQDADGRWDGGTAGRPDNNVPRGEDDYTSHCPPGEVCAGECRYFDVNTALSGLALLAYLGAGYTHTDGKYADTVGDGIDFLLRSQKPDGDLRGPSRAVGHVLPRDGGPRAVRGVRPDRRRAAPRAGGAGRRVRRPVAGRRRPLLEVRPARPGGRHEHPGLGGPLPEVRQGGRHPGPAGAQVGDRRLARAGRLAAATAAWPATSRPATTRSRRR